MKEVFSGNMDGSDAIYILAHGGKTFITEEGDFCMGGGVWLRLGG